MSLCLINPKFDNFRIEYNTNLQINDINWMCKLKYGSIENLSNICNNKGIDNEKRIRNNNFYKVLKNKHLKININ